MSLKMGVVVEMWECKTGLKVARIVAMDGVVTVELKGKDGDPRVKELQEKLRGVNGEYTGHRVHKTKHRERSWIKGADVDSHTHYQGELKAKGKVKQREYGKAR